MRHVAVVVLFVPFALALAAALPGRAEAYVRTTNGNTGLYWKEDCVPLTIYLNNFQSSPTTDMSLSAIVKSVSAAAHAWSTDSVTCPDGSAPSFEIVPSIAPIGAPPAPAAYDAKNSLIFRTDVWGRSGSGNPAMLYAAEGLAITTVTSEGDGHIVDADIEVNATNSFYVWMDLDPGVTPPGGRANDSTLFYDLQNTLTHEFGHFIGLAHTCVSAASLDSSSNSSAEDDKGNPVPDCDAASLPAAVEDAVMYPQEDELETKKRTLSPDDVNAVCAIYPASRVTATCALDTAPPPSCAVARPARRRPAQALAGLAAIAACAGLARARRRAKGQIRARSQV